MQSQETKENGKEGGCASFGCCNQEDLWKMMENNCNCFFGQGDAADFSAMKEGMMKNMVEMCCGLRAEGAETNIKSRKTPERNSSSTENQCGCS